MMRFRLITYSLCQSKVKLLCRSVKGNSCIVVIVNRTSGRGIEFSERNNVSMVMFCVKIWLVLNISSNKTQVEIYEYERNIGKIFYSHVPQKLIYEI